MIPCFQVRDKRTIRLDCSFTQNRRLHRHIHDIIEECQLFAPLTASLWLCPPPEVTNLYINMHLHITCYSYTKVSNYNSYFQEKINEKNAANFHSNICLSCSDSPNDKLLWSKWPISRECFYNRWLNFILRTFRAVPRKFFNNR